MTHITPQTAAALKAAGFPQPNPEIGQFWYLGNNLKWVMSHNLDTPGHFNMATVGSQFATSFAPGQQLEYMEFAPAAEDILNALGMGWCAIVFAPPEESPQSWCCCHFEDGAFSRHRWSASLAEACASAYLDKYPLK